LRSFLAAFPAGGGDLRVNLAHGQFVEAPAFSLRANLFEPIRRGCGRIDVIHDAHDDDAGWPRRSTTKRSFFWLALLMICPNWVRAVRADTTLVMCLEFRLMADGSELIN
jgi:hypothetical protein